MFTIASGFGIIISLTFLISACGKLADTEGTTQGLRSLRIPFPGLHRLFAVATPGAELLVAIGVWFPWRWGAVLATLGSVVMMCTFTVIIARALSFDEQVHCSCFGTIGTPAVSKATLARNIVLTGVAILAFLCALSGQIYPGFALWHTPLEIFTLTSLIVLAAAITVLIGAGTDRISGEEAKIASDQGRPTSATEYTPGSLPVETVAELEDYLRTPIPYATLIDLTGTAHTLRDLAREQAVLLLFVSSTCGSCIKVMEQIPQWREELEPLIRVVSIFGAELSRIPSQYLQLVSDTAMQDPERNVSTVFNLTARPVAILLGADGLLAGGPVTGGRSVREFVEDIKTELSTSAPPTGESFSRAATEHD